MGTKKWLHAVSYRLGQVGRQLGFVAPLSADDYKEVTHWLPAPALQLFKTMSLADQRHSLRVCRGLQARGCEDKDMLAAALLHDVGKAQGRVPFWTRPAIVLGKKLAPKLLARLVILPLQASSAPAALQKELECLAKLPEAISPGTLTILDEPRSGEKHAKDSSPAISNLGISHIPSWRRSLSYAWYHAEVGAELAAAAGLSERAVLYIRTHHQPGGPAAELHEVDEVS